VKAYAWEANGKFFLSKIPYRNGKPQPANVYATRDELAAEARQRKLTVEWNSNSNLNQHANGGDAVV
jgi:hypothetical protein